MFFVLNSFAQNKTIDSLNFLLNSTKDDSTRIRLYFALATACDIQDNLKYGEPLIATIDKQISRTPDEKKKRELIILKAKALNFMLVYYGSKQVDKLFVETAQVKLSLCQQVMDSACILSSYMNIAGYYKRLGNLPMALDYYQKGLSVCTQLNYKEGIAQAQAELADMYIDQGDTAHVKELYEKVLVLTKELNNKGKYAHAIMKTGGFYNAIGDYATALKYYAKAEALFKEIKDKPGLMQIYKNTSDTYNAKKEYEKALVNCKTAVQLAEQLKNPVAVANFMGRLANIYANQLDFNNAIETINKAIQYNLEHRGAGGDMQTWLRSKLALIYFKQKDFLKAKQFSDMTLEIMKASNSFEVNIELEKLAADIDSALGNYKTAYSHYQQYVQLRDKLNSEEVRKAATKEKFQAAYDKQKALDKAEQDQKDLLANEEKRKQKMITYTVITVLLLVMVFSMLIFRSLKITRKQKEIIEVKEKETLEQKLLIEEKHKEITDSINYAERIQRSFIASKAMLDGNLKEYFVLFKPKDIVSGDFYWAAKLNNGHFALVTADSTGHGVPGAIMSLLNITSLEKAIEIHHQPFEILNATRRTIIDRLKMDGSAEGGKDGMDASLTVYDFNNKKLIISAANNPVWIVRGTEMIEIKADKMPIGKHDKQDVSFTQQEVTLQTGDVVYSLTDGFPDQFGGEKGKKFMSKNLKELLAANAHLPMPEQKQLLEHTLVNWIGHLEQIDDITVIGIRV
jgi:serine phosphatase RsbU (regulator of sigma subunit)